MRFKDFVESTGLDFRQAIEVLKLMIGKYPLDMWAPNFQVSIANKHVLGHAWYSLRKNKIQTTPEEVPALLQQVIDIAQPTIHPTEDVLDINYNQSGLYDFIKDGPAPGTTGTYRVFQKGVYATAGNELYVIKRAQVSPA